MKPTLSIALLALTFLALPVAADECDIEDALERLQTEVVGVLDPEKVDRARKILTSLCTPPKEAESTQVLGVELRPADEDSKGHERLKRRGH